MRLCLLALGLAPLLTWAGSALLQAEWLVAPARAWFTFQCHHAPSRSFAWAGDVLPVCARCLGIYAALSISGLLAAPGTKWTTLFAAFTLGALSIAVDVATEANGWRGQSALLRVVTGALFGYPAGVALIKWARLRSHGV